MSPRERKARDWRHNRRPGRPWAARPKPAAPTYYEHATEPGKGSDR